jgi:membrane protein DedA with SNARE-associated domain
MQHFITTYGYLAVFLLMLAESACVPIPSELIMPLGGALAAGAVPGHHLSLALVIVAGVAGNVAGSYLAWAVGRWGGQAALHRWGSRIWLREHEIETANRWFVRHGPRAVLVGRLLPVVRTFISLPAGLAGMRPLRFGVYTAIGCVPWIGALAGAGFAIGASWQKIPNAFHAISYAAAAIVIIALAVGVWFFVRHARRTGRSSPDGAGAGAPVRSQRDGVQ